MKTQEQVKKEFTAELRALLAKYEAEIEIEDERMTATIPGIYDDKGETLRVRTEIDLGRWIHSAQPCE